MARIVLITGGARSGKSSYALARGEALPGPRLFVATCPRLDQEMVERVRRHCEERQGRGWSTVEEELDLAAVLRGPGREYRTVVIDCLTLWLNNIIYIDENTNKYPDFDDRRLKGLCTAWLEAASNHAGQVLCVTNEVGQGIVPENALARRYRDLVGSCNQFVAARAAEVVLVSCGIALPLKNQPDNPL